jgi:hypothetical protein
MKRDEPDLGKCCACQGTENVRNIVMHPKLAPVPGTGWGCLECHLPTDGAISVICDRCFGQNVTITEVCMGFPLDKMRVPLHALREEVFDHDMSFHQAEVEES